MKYYVCSFNTSSCSFNCHISNAVPTGVQELTVKTIGLHLTITFMINLSVDYVLDSSFPHLVFETPEKLRKKLISATSIVLFDLNHQSTNQYSVLLP